MDAALVPERKTSATTRCVQLLSIDIGTTTCCAVVLNAELEGSSISGKMQLQSARVVYQSEISFTPYYAERLDQAALFALVHTWLNEAGLHPQEIYAGGVIITGLSAQQSNAQVVAKSIRSILKNTLIHTVNDPQLEAWLAYKGCIGNSDKGFVLNLDIGGGTTNLAYGKGGNVLATCCLDVGARHFQFVPGSYLLLRMSDTARAILKQLHLYYREGDTLSSDAIEAIVQFYIAQLLRVIKQQPVTELLSATGDMAVAEGTQLHISGGVGRLCAQLRDIATAPMPAQFGDLGGELAWALNQHPEFANRLRNASELGDTLTRATAMGLALHNTEVTSNTIFCSEGVEFPLLEVPLIGCVDERCTDDRLKQMVTLQLRIGGAIYLDWGMSELAELKRRALQIQQILAGRRSDRLLVYLLKNDVAASFGNYLSAWRSLPLKILVMDNVAARNAAFLQIGAASHQVHPVSYFGIHSGE